MPFIPVPLAARCGGPPPATGQAPAHPPGTRPAALRRLVAMLAALPLLCTTAAAAPERTAARPDPLDARAPVPAAEHRSALAGYRPAGELKPGGWREANDRVARIGGWRAYAREAQAAEPAAAAASSAAGGSGTDRGRQP